MPNLRIRCLAVLVVLLLAVPGASAQVRYQLVLKGGHVIDPRNQLDAVMDVAVADGKIAAVRANINPAEARTVVDVSGLYVTPGLIDAHVHVFATTGMKGARAAILARRLNITSSGPNTTLGRRMVALSKAATTASSASTLERT